MARHHRSHDGNGMQMEGCACKRIIRDLVIKQVCVLPNLGGEAVKEERRIQTAL